MINPIGYLPPHIELTPLTHPRTLLKKLSCSPHPFSHHHSSTTTVTSEPTARLLPRVPNHRQHVLPWAPIAALSTTVVSARSAPCWETDGSTASQCRSSPRAAHNPWWAGGAEICRVKARNRIPGPWQWMPGRMASGRCRIPTRLLLQWRGRLGAGTVSFF